MDNKTHIAQCLLDIKAVSVVGRENLFTWASGIKSPIYCDNRMTMSFPQVRRLIADSFVEQIKAHYPAVEVIAGTATAGIPHAAWVAERLDLPMIYVRSQAKGHGKTNQIEGMVTPGARVVLIEDLISTGGSSLKAATAIGGAGMTLLGVGAIFTYNFNEADAAFKQAGIDYFTLSDYNALLPVAQQRGYIDAADLEALKAWRANPRVFSED